MYVILPVVIHSNKVSHESGECPYPTPKNHICVPYKLKDYHNNNISPLFLC